MEIAPIPNLLPMRVATPASTPIDLPTTRAIDLRRQQDQDDATYTPSGHQDDRNHPGDEPQPSPEILETAPADTPDEPNIEPDDLTPPSTISLFA
jgi:hypothetical protein